MAIGGSMTGRINPHSLRVGVIKDFSNDRWYDESSNNDYESRNYLKNRLNISTDSLGLLKRKVKLKQLLGKAGYKKVVNNVKRLSR